jgi:hypothetical protein
MSLKQAAKTYTQVMEALKQEGIVAPDQTEAQRKGAQLFALWLASHGATLQATDAPVMSLKVLEEREG